MSNTSVLQKLKDKVLASTNTITRIKVVKELFLEKLDNITSTLNQILFIVNRLDSEQDKLAQSQIKTLSLIDNISDNQPFFFQSSESTVKGVRMLLDLVHDQTQLSENTVKEVRMLFDLVHDQTQSSESTVKGVRMLLDLVHDQTQLSENTVKEVRMLFDLVHDQTQLSENTVKEVRMLFDLVHDQTPVIVRQSYFQGVEVGLMSHLYSFLPNSLALDIGANVGDISNYLLETGYEVYAFEPFPPVFEKLQDRFENNPHFHGYPFAIGSMDETKELFIVSDQTSPKIYQDSTLYSSLIRHSLCEGLVFTDSVNVTVKSLESLHKSLEIPPDISLVKIDTEGFDGEVLVGMGNHCYPVVMAEFWDAAIPFGESGAKNQLHDMVKIMKPKGYSWHIALYRIWGNTEASYYCNHPYSVENSWGNVFFFHEYNLFAEALKWCSATMPATYLSA